MRFVHALLISLALAALGGTARADSSAAQPTLAAPTSLLPQRLEPPKCPCEAELIAEQGFPFDQVGYIVFDLATGAIVASQNPDQGFIPASVQKLPTMVAALSLLSFSAGAFGALAPHPAEATSRARSAMDEPMRVTEVGMGWLIFRAPRR